MNQVAARDSIVNELNRFPLLDILRNDFFGEGFRDVARGRPFNPDFTGDRSEALHYQRGRVVAGEAWNYYRRVPQLWCETDAGSIINPQIISLAGAMFMTGAFT